jgi:transposase
VGSAVTRSVWHGRNRPRGHLSSWINQVKRFFAYITADLLQRSDHRSVQALEADIRSWIAAWNDNPRRFIWTKTVGNGPALSAISPDHSPST